MSEPTDDVPKTAETYGTPYTVGECQAALAAHGRMMDPYHRELMAFLLAEVDRLTMQLHTMGTLPLTGGRPLN